MDQSRGVLTINYSRSHQYSSLLSRLSQQRWEIKTHYKMFPHPLSLLRPDAEGRVFCLQTGRDSNCWRIPFRCDKFKQNYKLYFWLELCCCHNNNNNNNSDLGAVRFWRIYRLEVDRGGEKKRMQFISENSNCVRRICLHRGNTIIYFGFSAACY